jgi:nicotinic acid phosphoribosyltransferase
MDATVVEANIDGWAVSKILVDGGSSADIIFTATIDVMKIDRKLLGRAEHPLYGFGGKLIHSIGRIVIPISFGTVNNARIEQIAFDVVDIHYPYNTLFGMGTLNAFEAVISYSYLCMKMPAINRVITVHGDQTEARNIKKEYTPGRKNVHTIKEEEKEETENAKPQAKAQAVEETKKYPLTH